MPWEHMAFKAWQPAWGRAQVTLGNAASVALPTACSAWDLAGSLLSTLRTGILQRLPSNLKATEHDLGADISAVS